MFYVLKNLLYNNNNNHNDNNGIKTSGERYKLAGAPVHKVVLLRIGKQ